MLCSPTIQVVLAPFSLKQKVIHRSTLIFMVLVNLRKKLFKCLAFF